MSTQKNTGYIFAIFSAFLFGASTPAAKYLLGQIDPWLLAGLLYLGSGLGLLFLLIIRYSLSSDISREAVLTWNDWKWLLGATLSGGIVAPILLMYALVETGAATTSLLLNLESVFTAFIAWTVFKEHTDLRLIFGVILIVMGSFILGWTPHLQIQNILSLLLVAGACLAWAIDNNLTRQISAANPFKIVAIKSTVAGLTNTTLALLLGAALPKSLYIPIVSAGIGFIGYGLSLVLFVFALRNIGTARTSAYFSLAPFIGAGFAIIFLGEPFSWQIALSTILMGWGVWLHLTEYHAHEHEHEALLNHSHRHVHDEHHLHEHLSTDPEGEPHSHLHAHTTLRHYHIHYPDINHRHRH